MEGHLLLIMRVLFVSRASSSFTSYFVVFQVRRSPGLAEIQQQCYVARGETEGNVYQTFITGSRGRTLLMHSTTLIIWLRFVCYLLDTTQVIVNTCLLHTHLGLPLFCFSVSQITFPVAYGMQSLCWNTVNLQIFTTVLLLDSLTRQIR